MNLVYIRVEESVKKTELTAGGVPLRWPRDTLYPQKLALTSPTSGRRSVGIVRLWTKGHGVFSFKSGGREALSVETVARDGKVPPICCIFGHSELCVAACYCHVLLTVEGKRVRYFWWSLILTMSRWNSSELYGSFKYFSYWGMRTKWTEYNEVKVKKILRT
jgi:hypothetical protein